MHDPILTDITASYAPFKSGLPRAPGLHLTAVIKSLMNKLGHGKTAPGWEMNVCADIGFLWEDALAWAYRDKRMGCTCHGITGDIFRPPPMQIDGIWMSPDGVGPDIEGGEPWANHEYKCTWRSVNKSPLDDFYWSTQFQSYARGLGTRVTIVHVMYLLGDYKGSGPLHRVWRIVWDTDYMEQTWGMILREKEVMTDETK
jgi:hypothetical protein